ncbi:MAG: hypothetical protein AABX29_09375 [Nanoarchaeota archaeon]
MVVDEKNNCPFEIKVINSGIIIPVGKAIFEIQCGLNPNLFVFHKLKSTKAPDLFAINFKVKKCIITAIKDNIKNFNRFSR